MTVWRGVVVRLECLSSMELSDVLVSLAILKLEISKVCKHGLRTF